MRGAAILLLATGCRGLIGIEEAVPAELAVTYTEAGGGVAAGPGFELRFADGDRFHFPDELRIDGVDVLGHDPAQRCFDEEGVGFLIVPTRRISASGTAPRASNVLTPVLRGPAVVQVKLDWATRLDCNPARAPGGTSTFTVFPDGRIVRHDKLADPSAAQIVPSQCACEPSGELFTVATFWTFARAPFRDLYRGDMVDPQPVPVPGSGDPVISNTHVSCLDDGVQRQVALAWPENQGTTIRGDDKLVGFGFDFLFGSTVLPSFTYESGSALFVERSGCAAALARAKAHINPSMLAINGAMTPPSPRDGIYGSDERDGLPGFQLETGRAELTGSIDTSFAVWLRFPDAVDALDLTRPGASGPWYLPQRFDDRSWIVWFRDPLQSVETIAIEAL